MPEPTEVNNNPNTPAPGAAPTPPANPGNSTDLATLDFKNLTAEQIDKLYENPNLYQHPRFKSLSEAKQERDQLKAKADADEKKRLEEAGEHQKLKEIAEKERDEARNQLQETKKDSAIEREALKLGALDTEAVLKLVDKSLIKLDETGNVTGVAEALKALQESKGYLFGKGSDVTIGSPTNPGDKSTQLKRFKMSQVNDAKFYRENEVDIKAAMAANMIDMDQ